MDWKKEIVALVYVKQVLAEADTAKLWPHHFPSVAASEADIAKAQTCLGHPIDGKYAMFLRFANGWRGFYQTVDLFGTNDLTGSDLMKLAQDALGYIDDGVFAMSGVDRDDLLPIAATRLDMDLFAIAKPGTPYAGTVIWYAATEIQRFSDFDEFFLAMVDYNRNAVTRCQQKNGNTPQASH